MIEENTEEPVDDIELEEEQETPQAKSAVKLVQKSKEKLLKDKILEADEEKFAEIKNFINSQEGKESTEIDFPQQGKNDQETLKFIQKQLLYKGHDPFPDKLVQRPDKDAVWGLGGELLQRKNGTKPD